MHSKSSEFNIAILFITITFFVVVLGLLFFVYSYHIRKKLHKEEKKALQQQFEAELLKTQIEVQEQTMQSIASDLHDNIGQLLSLTTITLSSINIHETEKATKKIASSLSLVNKSIKELRDLAKLIHGEQILHLGLGEAVQQEFIWLKKAGSHKMHIRNELLNLKLLSPGKDLIILRLLQEIINNIIKHAKATKIEFDARFANELLLLSIKENGVGFDYEKAKAQKNGMGINSINKRVDMIDGKMEVISSAYNGTYISIEIPYP